MLRVFNICLVLGLVVLAYVIYQVKYEAKGLDTDDTWQSILAHEKKILAANAWDMQTTLKSGASAAYRVI